MPTRESILDLLRSGLSYPQIGKRLGVVPGLAYLVATGLPADGSDALGPQPQPGSRPGTLPGSTQHLSNPKSIVPQRDEATDAWIRQRAHDDAPLRAAWATHPVAPPAVAEDSDDLLDLIGHDHAQVEFLQRQLQTLPGATAGALPDDLRRRAEALSLLRGKLLPHEHAEDEVLWPLVRAQLPDGESLAEQARQQEHEARDLLDRIAAAPDDAAPQFDELVKTLTSALRKHVAFEDAVLAALRERVGEPERAEAGRRFEASRAAFTQTVDATGSATTGTATTGSTTTGKAR